MKEKITELKKLENKLRKEVLSNYDMDIYRRYVQVSKTLNTVKSAERELKRLERMTA